MPEPFEQVERFHRPTEAEFFERTRALSIPVIVAGIVDHWPAYRLWKLPYLRSKIGKRPVMAMFSRDGIFRADPIAGYSQTSQRMPFDKLLDIVGGAIPSDGMIYYLSQNSMELGAFSILRADIIRPVYIPSEVECTTNVWLGPHNIVSPLHFDNLNNLFAQISGRKRFTLFAPDQTAYLYPFGKDTKIQHVSQVKIDCPDLNIYPDFVKAKSIDVIVEAGDLLFIPENWWHQVYSLTMSISVNIWWKRSTLELD